MSQAKFFVVSKIFEVIVSGIFFEVETFSENEKISGRDVGGEKIKMREGDLERPSTFFQIKDFLIF